MAEKVVRVSDLSGELSTHRVAWQVGRTSYVLDLTEKEHEQFEKALKPWIEASTKTGGKRRTAAASSETATIRAWAQAEGVKVSDRGKLPDDVIAKYRATHPD